MQNNFGDALRLWRGKRRMSQLDLGLSADVSPRHVAFLEKGRSQPSRRMVLQLAEALAVPRAQRNDLLHAAGFAPVYRARKLEDADLAHVRAAMEWTLERHHPFPAFAIDRQWTLIAVNPAASRLLSGVSLAVGGSLLQVLANAEVLAAVFLNAQEIAHHMVLRLRSEIAFLGGDPVLEEAAQKLSTFVGHREADVPLPPVVPVRMRAGGTELSLFSTLAQFGTAEDIMLADLRIELMFPADEPSRACLLAAAASA